MKRILLIYTGGTICSYFDGEKRSLNPMLASSVLLENFKKSNSIYADKCEKRFLDSVFPEASKVLSENMTLRKQDEIAKHLYALGFENYAGVIILHGTDTLAFTANLFSIFFQNTKVPILFVSGNRPPMDPNSNANENFRYAVEYILSGGKEGVFVPYRNDDGIMTCHAASELEQCRNFSENFYSRANLYSKIDCYASYRGQSIPDNKILLIHPYVGLHYDRFDLKGIKAIVHGSYHSGTVNTFGNESTSLLYLCRKCEMEKIPLFIAPSALTEDQYESVFTLKGLHYTRLINFSTDFAYAKALAGITFGFEGDRLLDYMQR